MARHVRYATECWYCGKMTLEGNGYLHRHRGRWYAHCFKCYESKKLNSPNGHNGRESKGDNMKLELAILAGEESKSFLLSFTKQLDRLEALSKGLSTSKGSAVDEDDEEETETDDDEDFKPKKKTAAKAAAFDDDEEETETDDDEEEEPKLTKKALEKLVKDANDACKRHAKENSVNETKALLKKKFKTVSVKELNPEQLKKVVELMKGE